MRHLPARSSGEPSTRSSTFVRSRSAIPKIQSHPGEVLGTRPPPAQTRLPHEIRGEAPVPSRNREPDRAQLGQIRGLPAQAPKVPHRTFAGAYLPDRASTVRPRRVAQSEIRARVRGSEAGAGGTRRRLVPPKVRSRLGLDRAFLERMLRTTTAASNTWTGTPKGRRSSSTQAPVMRPVVIRHPLVAVTLEGGTGRRSTRTRQEKGCHVNRAC